MVIILIHVICFIMSMFLLLMVELYMRYKLKEYEYLVAKQHIIFSLKKLYDLLGIEIEEDC